MASYSNNDDRYRSLILSTNEHMILILIVYIIKIVANELNDMTFISMRFKNIFSRVMQCLILLEGPYTIDIQLLFQDFRPPSSMPTS